MEQSRNIDGPQDGPGPPSPRSWAPGTLLYDLVPSATWAVDSTGHVIMWSAAAQRLFGWAATEVLGTPSADLLYPTPTEADMRAYTEAQDLQGVVNGVYRLRCADGSVKTVESRSALAEEVGGEQCVVITSMDAEQLGRVETGLAIREALFDQSPMGIAIFDPDLRYLAVNEALARMNRLPAEEHVGRTLDEVMPGIDTARVRTIQQRVLDTGEPVVDSRIFGPERPDGGARTVWSMSYNRLQAHNGRILGISCSLIDVTERHHAMVKVDAARKRLALLNEVGTGIGGLLDITRIAEELVGAVVPGFADLAAVDLLDSLVSGLETTPGPHGPDTWLHRVASAGARAGAETGELLAHGSRLRYPADSTFGRCLRTGGSFLVENVHDEMYEELIHDPARAGAARAMGLHSLIVVPLVARGVVLGTLLLARAEGRPSFDPDDLTVGTELGARAAASIDNARLYRRQRDTAVTLQRNLLPQNLPELPGVEVAHRYLPGSEVTEVGGDWYDVLPLSGGRVGLVVGDVMGHGVHAAAVMGQLRTAVRTLAALDLPPADVLKHLDGIVASLGDLHYATCLYVVYDPVARVFEMAGAGHLPPVLVPPGGRPVPVDPPTGAMLGVGGLPYEQKEVRVDEGSLLVLYTDGLVETRSRDLDTGIGLLCDALDGFHGPLEDASERVVDRLREADTLDDVALLMARLDSLPEGAVSSWWLPTEPTMVARAREHTRKQLAEWQLAQLADIAELLVSELVTNALRHGAGPIRLRLMRGRGLLCEVSDAAAALPRLRDSGDTDEGGRGMQLVAQLAERWGSRPVGSGKVVWFELALPEDS